MTLKYDNQIRTETDQGVIDTLVRKGWTVLPEKPIAPSYNRDTEKIVYDEQTNSWTIVPLDENELLNRQQEIIFETISQGYTVQPENFTLGLQESDRNAFSQMLVLVKEALDLNMINDDTPQTIADISGNKHTISTLRFRQLMVEYGLYYKNLWNQLL
jgi:hypothetical protein